MGVQSGGDHRERWRQLNFAVDKWVFLSTTIEPTSEGFALHQHKYAQSKLNSRAVTKGRPSLPE
eukprot:5187562-Lingulodinium_polyedra.AAC.1